MKSRQLLPWNCCYGYRENGVRTHLLTQREETPWIISKSSLKP